MHHQKIDDRSRVWVIERGPDGKLMEQLDPEFLAALEPAIADALVRSVGQSEIAETRVW